MSNKKQTPKEKAIELVDKMLNVNESFKYETQYMTESMAKDSALISISDKIEELMWLNLLITTDDPIKEVMNNKVEELLQVEKEIQKL
jgi:hypothetical protein